MSKKIHGMSKRNWKCFFVGFALAWVCAGGCCAAFAGVPVKFTVETSRADVQEVQCYHGETLDFDVNFKNYGKDLYFPTNAEAQIFWQTNGMSVFYWRTNNVNVVSNHMMATFTPEMDPGAGTVFGFIGIPGDIYRASFVLRLKQSPGWKVREMEWPYRELDFSKVEMKNVPFYFKDESDELLIDTVKNATNKLYEVLHGEIEIATPGDYENVSNRAVRAVLEETDPTVPSWAKGATPPWAPEKIALGNITNKWDNPIVIRDIADNAEFNWQRVTTYESAVWTYDCLAYANGMFMIDNGYVCQFSKDGEKWESFRHGLEGHGLYAAKGKFYIASYALRLGNGLYVSEDGTNWIKIVEGRVRGLKEVNGHVLIGNENKIMVSDDGINFRDTNQIEGSFNTFAYKDGIYMAGERSNQVTDPLAGVYVSQDLMNWEKIDTAIVDVWGGDDIVFGTSDSSNRRVHYTTNGVDWINAGWRMGSQSQVSGCFDDKIIYTRNGFTYRTDRNGNYEIIAQKTQLPNLLVYSREKDRCVMTSGDNVYLSKKNTVVQQIRVNGKLIENDKDNVANIELPTPGNYETVSNRAMNAIQYGEVEPPGNYAAVSNAAMTALQPGSIENTVTKEYIRQKLEVYLYVGEDGGIYVHTGD